MAITTEMIKQLRADTGAEVTLGDNDEKERCPADNDEWKPKFAPFAYSALFFFAGEKIGEIYY